MSISRKQYLKSKMSSLRQSKSSHGYLLRSLGTVPIIYQEIKPRRKLPKQKRELEIKPADIQDTVLVLPSHPIVDTIIQEQKVPAQEYSVPSLNNLPVMEFNIVTPSLEVKNTAPQMEEAKIAIDDNHLFIPTEYKQEITIQEQKNAEPTQQAHHTVLEQKDAEPIAQVQHEEKHLSAAQTTISSPPTIEHVVPEENEIFEIKFIPIEQLNTPVISEHKLPPVVNEQKSEAIAQIALPTIPVHLNLEEKKQDQIAPIQQIPIPAPEKKQRPPESLLNIITCPISLEIMRDPVMTTQGHTYERSTIQAWFDSGHKTDPLTNQPLLNETLITNYAIKSIIESILNLSGDPKKSRNELESEQKSLASLLQPLEKYAFATGFQAFTKGHQPEAKELLIKLRAAICILNRCDSQEAPEKMQDIYNIISKAKPKKDSGEYLKSLLQVERNIKNHFNAELVSVNRIA